MLFTSLGLGLLALPAIMAQQTYQIGVGEGGTLTYNPEYLSNVNKGDKLVFQFHPKNHTLTQSSYSQPCIALPGGYDTGFIPVASDSGYLPTVTYTVPSDDPQYFYCRQTGHCGKGMVFAINAAPGVPGQAYKAFKATAIATNGTNAWTTTSSTNAWETTNAWATTPTAYAWATTPPANAWATTTTNAWATTPPANAWATTPPANTWATTTTNAWATTPPANAWATTSAADTWTTTTGAPSAAVTITVGVNGTLTYSPPSVNVTVGSQVTFWFTSKNHTVTQSSFGNPCQPLTDSYGTTIGFDSGFIPVQSTDTTPHSYTITVNDTKPIWFYCRQTGHCQQGMVGSVNAPWDGPNPFWAYQQLARQYNGNSYPAPADGSSCTNSASYAGTTPVADNMAPKNALADSSSVNLQPLKTNTFVIIALLALVIVFLLVILGVLARRNRGYKVVPASGPGPETLGYKPPKGGYTTPYSTADAEEYRD